jgi:hypothetical protein
MQPIPVSDKSCDPTRRLDQHASSLRLRFHFLNSTLGDTVAQEGERKMKLLAIPGKVA